LTTKKGLVTINGGKVKKEKYRGWGEGEKGKI
jgi:hypothetical protein